MHEGKPVKYHPKQIDEREEGLLKDLAALPRSRQPEHDAWQQIASRIANEKASERVDRSESFRPAMRGWLALAASVLLLVASSVFVMNGSDLSAPSSERTAQAGSDQQLLSEIGARVPADSLEREYQAAFKEFVRLEMTQSGPSADEREAIQQDWQRMLQLEQELQAALAQEPENPWLAQRLRKLRAHQLQLLRVSTDTGEQPGSNLI